MSKPSQSSPAPTPARYRLSLSNKLAWGSGGYTVDMVNIIWALALPIYSIALGVPATWIGIGLALPRIWDALTDPVMGNISDNTRSRLGRRRPYILIGAGMIAVTFFLIWTPPTGLGNPWLFAYFIGTCILFYTSYTIWSIPWQAMGLELTPNYHERTALQAYREFFARGAGLLLPWAYWLSFQLGETEVQGVRIVGLMVGLTMAASGVLSGIFCKERFQTHSQEKIRFWESIKLAGKNRAFIRICAVVALFTGGILAVIPMQQYVNIFHVFGYLEGVTDQREAGSRMSGMAGTTGAVVAMLSVPLINWLSRRLGKRKALLVGMGIVIVGQLSQWFTYRPDAPYLQLLSQIMIFPGISFIWIIVPSMLADLCDIDEVETGRRREGIYSAVYQWTLKLGVSVALMISGFLIDGAGITPASNIQPEGAVTNIRLMFCIIPAVFVSLAAWIILRYPITEERVHEAKAILEVREGHE